MAYSGYAQSIDGFKNNFSSYTSNIENEDLSSLWEGNAANKQIDNIKKAISNAKLQEKQLIALSSALVLIDEYDTAKSKYDSAYTSLSELDSESSNYDTNYEYYTGIMNENSEKMSSLTERINNLLNCIVGGEGLNISLVPATALVSTTQDMSSIDSILTSFDGVYDVSNYIVSSGAGDFDKNPDFSNTAAWISENPYASNNMGQCTWFAWGRFYEIYGYSPGFTGHGYQCVGQLLNAHGDKFYQSDTPVAGSVFSTNGVTRNHVGIIIAVDGDTITVQDGNYDGHNNGWDTAQSDWGTWTTTLSEFQAKYGGGVIFANPK